MPADPESPKVRFGPYEADFSEGVLRKDGRLVKMQAKPLAVLELLVRKQGKVVSHVELRRAR